MRRVKVEWFEQKKCVVFRYLLCACRACDNDTNAQQVTIRFEHYYMQVYCPL